MLFIVVFLVGPCPLYMLSVLHCRLSLSVLVDRWIVIPHCPPCGHLVCNLTPQLTKWLNQMAAAEIYPVMNSTSLLSQSLTAPLSLCFMSALESKT